MRARSLASLSSAVLICAACATANSSASSGSETVRVSSLAGGMTAEIHPSDQLRGGDIPAPIDRTWAAMRAVYDSLNLPVASVDPSAHVIESPNLRLRRRLGDTPLNKYLRCGDTQGGQSVDTYEIQMSVRTSLKEHNGATTIMTSVSAEGRPITISADYTRCTSTGNLESRVVSLASTLAR